LLKKKKKKKKMQNTQEVNHPIYARENDLSKADGVAYVLTDPKGKLVQYPFKFPQLGKN
jgi:hypothetical protein